MILCDLGRAFTVVTIAMALWFEVLTIWQIYAAAFIEGSLFVFFNIAEVAALPRVVPTAQLPQAAAQNEAAFSAAHIVGPSFGTLLYQTLGARRRSSRTRCRIWFPCSRCCSSARNSARRSQPR